MSLTIQPLERAHVDAIRLRPEDVRELSEGWEKAALAHGASYAALDAKGSVVAVGGVIEGSKERGVWLLCSRLVETHKVSLGRTLLRALQGLRREPEKLIFNHIAKDSPGNRQFVERLGFRIIPSPGDGPDFFYLPHV